MKYLWHDRNFDVPFPLIHPNMTVSFYWVTHIDGITGQIAQWIKAANSTNDDPIKKTVPNLLLLGIYQTKTFLFFKSQINTFF